MTRFNLRLRRAFGRIPNRFWAVLVCLCAMCGSLLALYATINVVVVSDSVGERRMLLTASEDPAQLMALSGINAGEYDDVQFTSYQGNIASLTIQRAYPVQVLADGQTLTAQMTEGNVQEALAQVGLELGEHDYTEPTLSTDLAEGDSVEVHRVTYNDTVTQEAIAPGVDYQANSLLYRRTNKSYVLQEGKAGMNEIVTRQRVVDGEVESAEVVSVTEKIPARNTVVLSYAAGVPVSPLPAPAGVTVTNGVPSSYRAVHTGRATGYSSQGGRGASGMGLYAGTVAVNPAVIPYGSLLYITSTDGRFVYGFAIATDTGAALSEGHALVDLYYETYAESVFNAVNSVNVYVL